MYRELRDIKDAFDFTENAFRKMLNDDAADLDTPISPTLASRLVPHEKALLIEIMNDLGFYNCLLNKDDGEGLHRSLQVGENALAFLEQAREEHPSGVPVSLEIACNHTIGEVCVSLHDIAKSGDEKRSWIAKAQLHVGKAIHLRSVSKLKMGSEYLLDLAARVSERLFIAGAHSSPPPKE